MISGTVLLQLWILESFQTVTSNHTANLRELSDPPCVPHRHGNSRTTRIAFPPARQPARSVHCRAWIGIARVPARLSRVEEAIAEIASNAVAALIPTASAVLYSKAVRLTKCGGGFVVSPRGSWFLAGSTEAPTLRSRFVRQSR